MKKQSELLLLKVGARNSPLSKKQVEEVHDALVKWHPCVRFFPIYKETRGDLDQTVSLRTVDKSNFFTDEIDQMLLKGECRIAIHSAKDLPEPLTQGLALAALTRGIDPSDSLVLRSDEALSTEAIIATSSERREENVKKILPHATFIDIRGKIHERLELLIKGKIDGVVIAEAALIRLGLNHLPRIKLPGTTALLQGKLAVVIKKEDQAMKELFQVIHDEESSLSRS